MVDPDGKDIDRVIEEAARHAESIGVDLQATGEGGRIMFAVRRGDGPPGTGAQAIRRLVDLADGVGVDVALDVEASEPALIRYYWRFGFRMHDGTPAGERGDLAKLEQERLDYVGRTGRTAAQYGVTTMWRDRNAGPLDVIDA